MGWVSLPLSLGGSRLKFIILWSQAVDMKIDFLMLLK